MDKKKKEGRYLRLYNQIEGLLQKSPDQTAKMATISAILYNKMDYFFWCGFYRVEGNRLIVGPYQGPAACQVLEGRGVCLAAVEQQKPILVPDVHLYPGHIACDSRSLSEVVIPVKDKEGRVIGVLDVDSKELSSFDDTDVLYLQKIAGLIA